MLIKPDSSIVCRKRTCLIVVKVTARVMSASLVETESMIIA